MRLCMASALAVAMAVIVAVAYGCNARCIDALQLLSTLAALVHVQHAHHRFLPLASLSLTPSTLPLPFSHDGYFVDLFVRKSNNVAISMYEKFGYSIYRRVLGYYSGTEDAYGTSSAAVECSCRLCGSCVWEIAMERERGRKLAMCEW